jgi:hypothetical protein
MSRQVFLSGVAICLITAAFLLTDFLLCPPGVTEANVNRLRLGMRLKEVTGILGKPTFAFYEIEPYRPELVYWRKGKVRVLIRFDDHGIVTVISRGSWRLADEFCPVDNEPAILNRLRSWLRW